MIYLDNAATSFIKPDCVKEAVYQSFAQMGNAGRGAHVPTLNASRLMFRTRQKLAGLFHVSNPANIAFTANVTQALNMAIDGLLQSGEHAITTVCEHNSVLRPLYRKQKEGAELTILDADANGRIYPEQIRDAITYRTKAVVISHASNVTGIVLPLAQIAEYVHQAGALLIVDAAQSAGSIPIDMEQMGIDVLCFTGHKSLLGPQGTGGICVREGLSIPSYYVGGSGVHSFDEAHPSDMPTALEAGTLNAHGIAGLEAAIDYLMAEGIEKIHYKEMCLLRQFLSGISDIPEIKLYGDFYGIINKNPISGSLAEESENQFLFDRNNEDFTMPLRAPIVTCNIGHMDASLVSDILWEEYGICVRAGAHCAPLMHKHFGTEGQGAVRFSFSYFNTPEEIDAAIKAIREIAEDRYRSHKRDRGR